MASHIKPRSLCSEKERIDPNVAMLACVLGCDPLFDKGAIYVDTEGLIRISPKLKPTSDLAEFLQSLEGKRAIAFSEGSKPYFKWHQQRMSEIQNGS